MDASSDYRPPTSGADSFRPCPICGSLVADRLHVAPDRWFNGPGRFTLVRCRNCLTAYLADPPADIAPYYPAGYIRSGPGPAAIRGWFQAWDLRPKVRLTASQPGRRVLDVGCARGDFLEGMRGLDWIVAGVEPTGWLADEAAARGLPVWPMTLTDASLPNAAFDVVTMWDVLEHLPDPLAGLAVAGQALRPGGRLLVNTPIEDGWEPRLVGPAWSGWDPPRHMTVFSRATLRRAVEASGFRVVEWHRVFETYLISALSVSLWAEESLPGPAAAALRQVVHARPVRLAADPVWRGLDRLFGAASLTVVAEKSG